MKYKVLMQRTFIESLLCAEHQVCLPPSCTFCQTGKKVIVSPRCEAREGTEVEVDGGKVGPAAESSKRAGVWGLASLKSKS